MDTKKYMNRVIFIILLIPVIYIYSAGRRYGNFLDNTYLFLPYYHSISEIFTSLSIPYRVNGLLAGMELYNIPHFSVLYPILFFWVPLYKNYDSSINAVTIITLLHIYICSLGAFYLFEKISQSKIIGLLGAIFLAYSSTYYSYYEQLPVLMPYCWFPIIALYIYKVVNLNERPNSDWVILGYSISMLLLSCFNHGMIHALILVLTLFTFNLIDLSWRNIGKWLKKNKYNILLLIAVVFSTSSSFIFSCISNMGNSIRWLGEYGALIGSGKLPYEAFNQDSLAPLGLMNFFSQTSIIVEHNSILLGYIVIFFFLYNLINNPKKSNLFLFFIISYFIISMLGSYTFVGKLNYHIPVINLIRLPTTHAPLVIFLIIYCFIIGVKEFLKIGGIKKSLYPLLIIILIYLTKAYYFKQDTAGLISIILILFVIVYKKLFFNKNNFYSKNGVLVVALLISVGWVVQNNYFYSILKNPISDVSDKKYIEVTRFQAKITQLEDISKYRILISDSTSAYFNRGFWANLGLWNNLNSFDVFMNPQPSAENFQKYYFFNNQKNIEWYIHRAGKYLICIDDCDQFYKSNFTRVLSNGNFHLLRNDKSPKIINVFKNDCTISEPMEEYNKFSFYYDCSSEKSLSVRFSMPYSKNILATINNEAINNVKIDDGMFSYEINGGRGYFSVAYNPWLYRLLFGINSFFIIFIPFYLIFKFFKLRK